MAVVETDNFEAKIALITSNLYAAFARVADIRKVAIN